jgi:hypothetical protein
LQNKFPGTPPMTYDEIRHKIIQEYRDEGVPASQVFAQSFQVPDVLYWIKHEGEYGNTAVMLGTDFKGFEKTAADMGVKIISPSYGNWVTEDGDSYEVTEFAKATAAAGMKLIGYTAERNYYRPAGQPYSDMEVNELQHIHAAAMKANVMGLFTDWPATLTFYANCVLPKAGDKCKEDGAICGGGLVCKCAAVAPARNLLFSSTISEPTCPPCPSCDKSSPPPPPEPEPEPEPECSCQM